jgi:stringent starvation protein B
VKSSRPYLLRALYEWILDSDCTPYILAKADVEGVVVPAGYATDGRITLNIAPVSVRNLTITDETLCFDGRFGGAAHRVSVPIGAVIAIHARETGQGMAFEVELPTPTTVPGEPPGKTPQGPNLRVIK